jgi:hypothetical protein
LVPQRLLAFAAYAAVIALLVAGCGSNPNPTASNGQPVVQHAYSCDSLLPSEASPDGLPGFTTQDLGRSHVRDPNTIIEYGFCPPTSGAHYNIAGRGPIRAGVYPANEERVPGGWVHNMEHGYVVALYRCPSGEVGQGDCISQSDLEQLESFFTQAPFSGNPSCPDKLVVARFDSMTTKFAVLAWDRALLTDTFDLDAALQFYQEWLDPQAAPEAGLC